jgi:hypothetical protein
MFSSTITFAWDTPFNEGVHIFRSKLLQAPVSGEKSVGRALRKQPFRLVTQVLSVAPPPPSGPPLKVILPP